MAAARRRGPAAAVEAQWESLRLVWEWRQAAHRIHRPGGPFPVLLPLLEAAGAQPRLRLLYPFTSHSILRFSSSTTFPWTVQGGSVEPLYDGRFRVRPGDPHAVISEVDSPEEAVSLVLELLPDADPVITAPEASGRATPDSSCGSRRRNRSWAPGVNGSTPRREPVSPPM